MELRDTGDYKGVIPKMADVEELLRRGKGSAVYMGYLTLNAEPCCAQLFKARVTHAPLGDCRRSGRAALICTFQSLEQVRLHHHHQLIALEGTKPENRRPRASGPEFCPQDLEGRHPLLLQFPFQP